jgi:predicted metal-dependent HD superfamily phosphohydrolase
MDALKKRWESLANKYSRDPGLVETLWVDISKRHSEPHRHYHTLKHLECLFRDIDAAEVSSDAVEFSIWFHDIIYKPGSSSNEKLSAKLAREVMKKLGVPSTIVDQAAYMIDCTKSHVNPQECPEAQLFLDADMAILGVEAAVYKEYLNKVRKEFSKTPEFLFSAGRKRFVEATLNKEKIFSSGYFYKKYELNARRNLEQELVKGVRAL